MTASSPYRIESITLDGMLPAVFANEPREKSSVWRTQLTFRRGEHYLVEATSGAGKSSMCAYIFGARTDFQGRLLFNETDTQSFDMARWQEIRRRNLAYLPQEPGLFPELTLIENIRLKNSLTGYASEHRIADWIEELGLASRSDRPAGRLSVGQQQRAALIRSLCQPFDFILLDEPVSHLDEANNRIAAGIISREAERQGAGIISTSVGNHLLIPYGHTLRL